MKKRYQNSIKSVIVLGFLFMSLVGTLSSTMVIGKPLDEISPISSSQTIQIITQYPTNPNTPLALTTGKIILSASSLSSDDLNWTTNVTKPTLYFSMELVRNLIYCLYFDLASVYPLLLKINDVREITHTIQLNANGLDFVTIRSPTTQTITFQIEVNVTETAYFFTFAIGELFLEQITQVPLNTTINTALGVENNIHIAMVDMNLNLNVDNGDTKHYLLYPNWGNFNGFQYPYTLWESQDTLFMEDYQTNQNLNTTYDNGNWSLHLESDKDLDINGWGGQIDQSLGGPNGIPQTYVVFSNAGPFTISEKQIEHNTSPTTTEDPAKLNGFDGILILGIGVCVSILLIRKRQ